MTSIRPYNRFVPLLLLVAAPAFPSGPMPNLKSAGPLPSAPQGRVIEGYGKLPLSFEANQGQTDSQVKFLSRGDGYSLFLTPAEAVLSLRGKHCSPPAKAPAFASPIKKPQPCAASPDSLLRMKLLGSNADAEMRGEAELPGKSNYFMGNDPSAWRTNITNYRKVQYRSVYPGIDLVYYGNQRQLEHDFIVAPGANPKAIRLNFTGARRLSIDRNGNLQLITSSGVTEMKRPAIYQETEGVRREVSGRYVKKSGGEIGFSIGAYDRKEKLVIDPVLVYSTYFGDEPFGIAADSEGNTYVTGDTQSTDFPLVNPLFPDRPPTDEIIGFVSKISADGSAFIYSTFLGGSGYSNFTDFTAYPTSIAVDGQGNAYVTGYTSSPTYPVVNALQPKLAGQSDVFVTKLNAAGSALEYSTYLGGSGRDTGYGIAVDSLGAAYLTGSVGSYDFPKAKPLYTKGSVFISKLNPAGSALEYSTLFGGSVGELSFAIAVDTLNEAMITGYTYSSDLPLKHALYSTLDPVDINPSTAFVTKFNADGSGLLLSTYLGGGIGYGIATNASGDAFVTGLAYSSRRFASQKSLFPTSILPNTFVTRLKADGSLVYSTYLGTVMGGGYGIAADSDGNAYVTGWATNGFPLKDAVYPKPGGFSSGGDYQDAFIAKLDPAGSNIIYSTYFGGSENEFASAVAIDGKGDVFISGQTESDDIPVKNALLPTAGCCGSGFVFKIFDGAGQFSITNTVDHTIVGPGGDLHYTVTVTNNGATAASGVVTDKSVRESLQSCTVSGGETCTFVPRSGRATVNLAPFASGESKTISIYAKAATNAGDYNPISNVATIYSGAPIYESDSASAPVTVRETADISIASSLVDSTNGLLHFVHTVTNLGPDNAHAVLLLNPLPANTSYVSASTTAGKCSFHPTIGAFGAVRCPLNNPDAGSSVQVDVVVQASNTACPAVTDTASVTSQSIDTVSANDAATVVAQLPQSLCAPPPTQSYKP